MFGRVRGSSFLITLLLRIDSRPTGLPAPGHAPAPVSGKAADPGGQAQGAEGAAALGDDQAAQQGAVGYSSM